MFRKTGRGIAGLMVSVVAATVGSLAIATPAEAACNTNFIMVSNANGKAVTAEIGGSQSVFYYGVLRARASAVGPWERFTLCSYSTYYTIKSNANGRYVTAEVSSSVWNGVLRAQATSVGSREKFTKSNIGNGWDYTLASQANSKFVTPELGFGGDQYAMLRARSASKGPWEVFSVGW